MEWIKFKFCSPYHMEYYAGTDGDVCNEFTTPQKILDILEANKEYVQTSICIYITYTIHYILSEMVIPLPD